VLTTLCVNINGKISVVFNPKMKDFNVRPSPGSHEHRKSGSIKEMVQDRHVVGLLCDISHG